MATPSAPHGTGYQSTGHTSAQNKATSRNYLLVGQVAHGNSAQQTFLMSWLDMEEHSLI